ncbi:hypothetical protein BT69DRAFT_1237516 [Atractiella rhizophila]|nr:hypothetical protein BT69DRAFT_1237516 [Atractiella rhizophila]
MLSTLLTLFLLESPKVAHAYSATYLPSTVPNITEEGETGYNICGTGHSQTSMCQTSYVNSIDDFCLWAPPEPGANATIGETERFEVAWCTKAGHGTRLIPDGTLTGVHFVQTPDFVQITGVGDLTKINIPAGDAGGELDPHGADGNGNPIGGIVFSTAFTGSAVQSHEWSSFIGAEQFCIRVCKDAANAWLYCNHVYDEMGCAWNYPGDYSAGSFDTCAGDSGDFPGVYGTSTFSQGQPTTPDAHPAPSSSDCTSITTIQANGQTASSQSTSTSTSTTSTATTKSAAVTTGSNTGGSTSTPTSGAQSGTNNSAASSLSSIGGLAAAAMMIAVGAIMVL